MVEFIIFFLRYIPFWSVPLALICLPFSYIFWLKDIRSLCYFFALIALVSFMFLAFWVYCGGPDKAVEFFFGAVQKF